MTQPTDDPYLVISADCHAGLPNEQYREWLDPDVREAFDESIIARTRQQEMAAQGFLNTDFAEEWNAENEEGLRGGWDGERRDKELSADGVVGEVIFPDADSVTSGASAPFGAGLGSGSDTPPELLLAGATAHNRWLAELCATSPKRRAGIAVVPIIAGVDESVAEIRRAHASGLWGGILIPPMWQPHEPYHHAKYDPIWAVCSELGLPVHVHSGPADKASYGPHIGIYTTEVLVWSTPLVPHLVGRVRAVPRPALRGHRVRRLLGQRPAVAHGPGVRARPRQPEAGGAAHQRYVDAAE